MDDLISIVLPVYNGEKYLAVAIDSFLNQTHSNFELIIVNDCSKDSSLAIAESYAARDARIKIINNRKNKKLPASLNIGHQQAKGEYLTWTSDDNTAKSNFLECLLKELKNKKASLVFSNYDIISEDGSLRRKHTAGPLVNLIFGNIFGASFMYKKEVFEKLKGYNESLFLVEDYDFWLRASLQFTITHLNENLYEYRLHGGSLTREIHNDNAVNEKYVIAINFMYKHMAEKLRWNAKTEKVVKALHLGCKIDLNEYLSNRKVMLNDLALYVQRVKSSDSVKNKLWYLLRNQWKSQKEFHNIRTLLKVLINAPKLLFFGEFSRKQTVLLILKCLKKI